MQRRIIRLHGRSIESLSAIGFAVQRFANFRNPDSVAAHGHDILELNFVVRGTAFQRIGDVQRKCPPGSLGIIHYGQEHCLATDKEGIEVINLYLDPANHALPRLPPEFSAIVGALFPPVAFPGMPAGLISFIHFADHAPLAALLHYCCAEQEARKTGYLLALESALRIFLIACARQVARQGVETLVADPSRWRLLEELRRKLERELATPHRLADLAAGIGISEAHLCRRFKVYTGLSPFAYLAQCRVRAAMQELRNSNRKVLDIALAVGFQDLSHFNRKFRHFAQCTPSQYRRLHTPRND